MYTSLNTPSICSLRNLFIVFQSNHIFWGRKFYITTLKLWELQELYKNQEFTLFPLSVKKMLHFQCLLLFPNCIQRSGLDLHLKEAVTSLITQLHLTWFTLWKMNATSIFHTLTEYMRSERILLSSHFCWKKQLLNLGLCSYYQTKSGKNNKGLHLLHGSRVWCNYYQWSPVCKMFLSLTKPQ